MHRAIPFSPQGKNLNIYYHLLLVHIIGQVKSAKQFEGQKLYCKFNFRAGKNWRLLSGKSQGQTYQEKKLSSSQQFIWDHPLDLHYVSRSVRGWPKIFVQVWEVNQGRHSVSGYGTATIPSTSGNHTVQIHCWRPFGNSSQQSAAAYLGARPQLQFKDILFSSGTRFGLDAETAGKVYIDIGIIVKDFQLHGVTLGEAKKLYF